jgi:hypothetical protein
MSQIASFFVTAFFSGQLLAVSAGYVDDFEDGTTQGWEEGEGLGTPNPNPPTNVADGGPNGAGDNYLENVSAGGAGSGSKQIIFNTGANWTGNYAANGINLVRLDVQVEDSSEGPLHLRFAYEGLGGTRLVSTDAVVVPNDGTWHTVEFHINPTAFSVVAGAGDYFTTIGDVSEVRIIHAPAGPAWSATAYDGTVGYDNISTMSVSFFEGWIWETGVGNSPGVPELWEENCFGPFSLKIDSGDNWTLSGTDACVGRTTTNSVPARSHDNYDQGSNTILFVESFEARSTQPLVSAGDNLLELYGEDVEMGVGLGEERLATVLAIPSNSNLLIAGFYGSFGDANYAEAYGGA